MNSQPTVSPPDWLRRADDDPAWGFDRTSTPEPHALRRARMLEQHPAIAELFGHDRTSVLVMLLSLGVHLGVAWLLSSWARGADPWLWVPAAVVLVHGVGALLSHQASMFIHEASHNLCAPTARENKGWALVANTALLIPAAMTFRKYHPRHHAHLGTLGVDADLPCYLEANRFPRARWAKGLWLVALLFFWVVRGYSRRTPPNRDEVVNVLVTLVVNGLLYVVLGPVGIAYLAASTIVGHSYHPVAAHFIHEHFVFADGQETNSYYGVLNRFCFNVGYHVEHHDFPRIPGSRLPTLRARHPEWYEDLTSHRSWTAVLLDFVANPRLDWSRRIARKDRRGGPWEAPDSLGTPVLLAPVVGGTAHPSG